jgi:hypothetical protein
VPTATGRGEVRFSVGSRGGAGLPDLSPPWLYRAVGRASRQDEEIYLISSAPKKGLGELIEPNCTARLLRVGSTRPANTLASAWKTCGCAFKARQRVT